MRRIVIILFSLVLLTACGLSYGDPGDVVEVPVRVEIPVTVEVTVIPTQLPSLPTAGSTVTAQPLPVVYYFFPAILGDTFPAGSVEVLADNLILSPSYSEFMRSGDPATDVYLGLQAAINDPRNPWTGQNLKIDDVSYNTGQVTIMLSGEIFGTGDVVLIAARWQLLLTIFANEAVQTAKVILNGQSIANMGISHESQAQPVNFQYTRADIEIYMAENAFN